MPPPRDAGPPAPRQIWPPPDSHHVMPPRADRSVELKLVDPRIDVPSLAESPHAPPEPRPVPRELPAAIVLVPPLPPTNIEPPAARLSPSTRVEKVALSPAALPAETPAPPAPRPSAGLLRLDPALADAARSLWTELVRDGRGIPPRRLLLTSVEPGAGVSVIAAALALHVAQSRPSLRVLLVDFNLRRPALAGLFGAAAGPGVGELLDGRATMADCLASVELGEPGATATLSLLTAGLNRGGGGARETAIRALLDDAADRFDHVLMDGGAVFAGGNVTFVARAADAAALIVQPGRTWCDAVESAREQLAAAGVRRMGLVFNHVE